jgi:hypothetical protein
MSAKNVARKRVGRFLIAAGSVLVFLGVWAAETWGLYASLVGTGLFLMGFAMWSSVSLIDGVPWLIRMFSRHTEPAWEGEVLYVDSSYIQVRYLFDARGNAWFLAKDVCAAIGVKPPIRDALRWGGVPLLQGKHVCFSEDGVHTYLAPLAKSHEAARLLTLIRNDLLRKLNREREAQHVYSGDTPAR